jgi:hypothetical protein
MRSRRAALAAASVALVLPAAACGAASQGFHQGVSAKSSSPTPSASRSWVAPATTNGVPLILKATGTVPFHVAWFPGKDGKTQGASNVTGPWEQTVYSDIPQSVGLSVTAENGGGAVSCQIVMNGKVVAHDQQSGSNGANCNGPTSQ